MIERDYYLHVLQLAIILKYECMSAHRETVFVREETKDEQIVWTGNVEVFDLEGHKKARVCYCWAHTSENEPVRVFAILANQLINSPQRAVQVAIFSGVEPVMPPNVIESRLQQGTSSQRVPPQ